VAAAGAFEHGRGGHEIIKQNLRVITGLLLLGASLGAGCGSSQSTPSHRPDQPASGTNRGPQTGDDTPEGVQTYSVDELTPTQYRLPPLDGGRVKLPVPENWKVMSRRQGYLARFYRTDPSLPPRITVTIAQVQDGGPATATRQDLDSLLERVREHVHAQLLEGERLVQGCRPLVLGGTPWVGYVRRGKVGRMSVERQFLKTIARGRMVTIELLAVHGTLTRQRHDAYAVAAGMECVEPERDNTPDQPEDEPSPDEDSQES
jgi:hypothetical protein